MFPQPNPAAARQALKAAIAAGAPIRMLAMLHAQQVAQLLVNTALSPQNNPYVAEGALRVEYTPTMLEEDSTEDGWTLTVRWDRPTAEDVDKAAETGVQAPPQPGQPTTGRAPIALGGPSDVEVIR
jgi:hypothetical protein